METSASSDEVQETTEDQPKVLRDVGHDNRTFADETGLPNSANKNQLHLHHQQPHHAKYNVENSKL